MKKSLKGYLYISPLVVGCVVFYLAPFCMMLRYSLSSGAGKAMKFVGLENYFAVAQNETFRLAFANTLKFLAVGLPMIMLLAYLIALLLKNHAAKHKLLKSVFLFPYIMPVVGTVLLVELIFGEAGLLNRIITPTDWLSGQWAFWVAELLYLWKNTGYAVILLLAGLVTIPDEQYESAELDGAGVWQKFRLITTPQMWYSVFFALIFSVINAFKCFREIFLIGGRHPDDSLYMLQHFINNSFENLNYAKLSVSSVLLLIIILVFFGALYIFVDRKERYKL